MSRVQGEWLLLKTVTLKRQGMNSPAQALRTQVGPADDLCTVRKLSRQKKKKKKEKKGLITTTIHKAPIK